MVDLNRGLDLSGLRDRPQYSELVDLALGATIVNPEFILIGASTPEGNAHVAGSRTMFDTVIEWAPDDPIAVAHLMTRLASVEQAAAHDLPTALHAVLSRLAQ